MPDDIVYVKKNSPGHLPMARQVKKVIHPSLKNYNFNPNRLNSMWQV